MSCYLKKWKDVKMMEEMQNHKREEDSSKIRVSMVSWRKGEKVWKIIIYLLKDDWRWSLFWVSLVYRIKTGSTLTSFSLFLYICFFIFLLILWRIMLLKWWRLTCTCFCCRLSYSFLLLFTFKQAFAHQKAKRIDMFHLRLTHLTIHH